MSDDNVVDINEVREEKQSNEAVLLTFTNHKDEQNLGVLQGLLKMFYHIVLTNRLAIMQAKNADTGEEEIVLVGVEQNGEGVNCYPLAVPISAEQVGKYIAPDGQGGWINPTVEDGDDAA